MSEKDEQTLKDLVKLMIKESRDWRDLADGKINTIQLELKEVISKVDSNTIDLKQVNDVRNYLNTSWKVGKHLAAIGSTLAGIFAGCYGIYLTIKHFLS